MAVGNGALPSVEKNYVSSSNRITELHVPLFRQLEIHYK